ncbi:MAG TPA: DUF4389 domain-containing protein [Burkholderiaceae bacterium]|nr:DUF4389 domain-containing protein [Burkholderiaceae bacterium]
MNQHSTDTTNERNILVRGLLMLLMAIAYQLSGTLLFFVAIIQFAMALLSGVPNARLLAFGRSLGRYINQLVNFFTFASEEVPFPFSEWPSEE